MRADDAPRTPHGGRKLEEAYFATGANAFLEQAMAKAVDGHFETAAGASRVLHEQQADHRRVDIAHGLSSVNDGQQGLRSIENRLDR